MRLEDDAAPVNGSPHIFAEKVTRWGSPSFHYCFIFNYIPSDYVCELWVEDSKLLGNLSLSTAISSYLHLCFSFDLKYPKVRNGCLLKDFIFQFMCRVGKLCRTYYSMDLPDMARILVCS